jgi:plastocyanin
MSRPPDRARAGSPRPFRRLIPTLLLLPLLFASAAPAARPLAQSKRHVIEMQAFAFQPTVLEVTVGDTIAWVNRDAVPHTATAEKWDTGNIGAGATGVVVARGKGEHTYICAYHPSMKAKVVVR